MIIQFSVFIDPRSTRRIDTFLASLFPLFSRSQVQKIIELNRVMIKAKTYVEGESNGVVHYTAPYSRFQYHGKVMISPLTGSTWSHGEGKVATDRDLEYSKVGATAK